MKIYMVTDLEGVGGVVRNEQTTGEGAEYEVARSLLTKEVNAAIQGALDGGADEVLVLDGHGARGAYNFIYEELHPEAEYIMGAPWEVYLPGLDASCHGCFFVGFHPMAGTRLGVLDHTMSAVAWQQMTINGQPMGELGLCAAVAGHYDVPVVLVTGDQAACDEARALLGEQVETVATKVGLSRNSARMRHPAKVRREIEENAKAAMGKIKKVKPLKIAGPVEIRVTYGQTRHADGPKGAGKERVDATTVAYRGADIIEAVRNLLG